MEYHQVGSVVYVVFFKANRSVKDGATEVVFVLAKGDINKESSFISQTV